MELSETIKGRRSVRHFQLKDVPGELVEKLVEAATCAPSAGNLQPWIFVIVKNPDVKKRLAEAAWNQRHVEEASVVIVVCADEGRSSSRYGERGRELYCLQDTAAAIQNLLLTAHSLGLGACWTGAFDEKKARKALNAPAGVRPVAMIPVGYAGEVRGRTGRRALSDVIRYDGF